MQEVEDAQALDWQLNCCQVSFGMSACVDQVLLHRFLQS